MAIVMLVLTIDRADTVPVYEQIADQLRRFVASGDLRPGVPIPPVRQLAGDLGVNLNTVARAYRLLRREGFLRIRDRSGVEVAAPGESTERTTRSDLLGEMRTTMAKLRQAGMTAEEILSLLNREVLKLAPQEGGTDHD